MGRGGDRARASGMGIAPRFALTTTLVMALVITAFAFILVNATRGIVQQAVADARNDAAEATALEAQGKLEYEMTSGTSAVVGDGVYRRKIKFKGGVRNGEEGAAYVTGDDQSTVAMVAPYTHSGGDPIKKIYGLFFGFTAIALVIAGIVALWTANRVAKPITELVNDVRTIANGNLTHRVRARGGGEVALLSSAIDRMTMSLREAQDAEVELSVREREHEVAMEVQEALHSSTVSVPSGYDVASEHTASVEPGGDFHASIEADDGRTVYFVCDVSGTGVPGALVGAMARAYLKSTFSEGGPLDDALKAVNRMLASELRRGMYVTVIAAALDPRTHELEVSCAGHKLPLVHWSKADGSVRTIQPEGIALGFDKGPVFDRGIETKRIPMAAGDRIVMSGTGAVRVANAEGEEIGEKRFYKLFARNAPDSPADALDGLLTALEAYAGDEPFPVDVTAIVLGRVAVDG